MKKVLAGLCAGAFALALIGCGEPAPVKKPTPPKKPAATAKKCTKCPEGKCTCAAKPDAKPAPKAGEKG